jgi:hypothetical protein
LLFFYFMLTHSISQLVMNSVFPTDMMSLLTMMKTPPPSVPLSFLYTV